MILTIEAQVGTSGATVRLDDLDLSNNRFEDVLSWAGSYHVLNVGEHFEAYHSRPAVPLPNRSFPPLGYFAPLKHKVQSAEINANFGECLPALVALTQFGLDEDDMIHLVRTTGREKSPDYIFRLGRVLTASGGASGPLWKQLGQTGTPPEWWPLECKATAGSLAGRWNAAVDQLIQFWRDEPSCYGFTPGFGLVSLFEHNSANCRLLLRFVIPKPSGAGSVGAALASAATFSDAKAAVRPLLQP